MGWGIDHEEGRKAYQLGFSLGEPFRGLALTPKGVCIRVANDSLAAARRLILQGDVRFTELNRHVICKHTYTAQGFPFEVSHACVIEATHKAVGQPCIPLRSYRVGGMHTWVLGFSEHPKQMVFSVKVDDQTHEVILAAQANIRAFKPAKKQAQPKPNRSMHQGGFQPSNAPVATQLNMTQDDTKYSALETRVQKLEVQQSALAEKVDGGFSKMSMQLQQVLEAVSSSSSSFIPTRPRGNESTGDTPPPKQVKK